MLTQARGLGKILSLLNLFWESGKFCASSLNKTAAMKSCTRKAQYHAKKARVNMALLRKRVHNRTSFAKSIAFVVFLREWLRSPRAIGMVCPSGAYLAEALAASVPQNGQGYIVEVGAGTGTVTRQLLRSHAKPESLIVVERSAAMVDLLRLRFPGIRVEQADAAELSSLLATLLPQDAKVDCIVSSLPLVSLPDEVRQAIIGEFHQVLGQDGVLLQYTYSWGRGSMLQKNGFKCLSSKRVWRNLPPAKVMSLRNE